MWDAPPRVRAGGHILDGHRELVVTDAPGWLVGRFLNRDSSEGLRLIEDGQGEPLGRFELEPRTVVQRGLGLLFAGGSAIGSGRAHRVRVLDATGATRLRLSISLGHVLVDDERGDPIGEAQNTSRVNDRRTRVEVRAARGPRRAIQLGRRGPLLAGMEGEYQSHLQPERPFRWEVRDAGGRVAATVEHGADRRTRTSIEERAEGPLRAILVGFAVSMFDRFWLQIPTDSGGGV